MPSRPKKVCNKHGCHQLTKERYCEKHINHSKKQHDRKRGSAAERGYDYKWRKIRNVKLKYNPICECSECKTTKIVKVANMVHHIKNVFDYPELRLEYNNLMSLANECHERIEKELGKRW